MLSRKGRVGGLAAFVAALLFSAVLQAQTPISSCTRITSPGVYALTQNLAATIPFCITILASDVILDLNGFGIDATGVPFGLAFGIYDGGVPHGGLEIRNGFMRGQGLRSAIVLSSSSAWIHDIRFSDIAEQALQVGSGSLIQACSFRGIGDQIGIVGTDHLEAELNILDGAGVICDAFCSLFRNSISHTFRGVLAGDDSFIADNALHDIGGDGIVVGRLAGFNGRSDVFSNTLTGRGQGTGITGGAYAIIDTNQVSGFEVGISLESDGQVTTALVTGSAGTGIIAGPRSVVESSTSSGNGGFGIQLVGAGSFARNNHVSLNQSLAIDCTSGSGSRAAHNTYSGNAKDDTTCLNWGGNTPF